MLKALTVTNNIETTMPLINSLEKHGWKWDAIVTDWRGFGTKLISVYEHLKAYPEITEFIFCDAFDVLVLGNEAEFKEKVGNPDFLLSAERGCWPIADWSKLYAEKFEHGFNYVNSGLYYAKSAAFIDLMEWDMPKYETDDQMWFSKHYLDQVSILKLDHDCEVFQSYSFIADDDYTYNNNRLQNAKTHSQPIFVHGNGRTNMDKIKEIA